ncbi:outer membrane protein assembly factor BamA [Sulfuriflexus sp.]|uniref:outer membrane protein assembly factor BamA n=1 Tax=Sulfuriflexus sp. TaxID=2015443 RepID=UPI0028CEB16C|nr:outer membrane protein assembly factor BamA [Sulfuriflexus sp.]MDT8402978.1 outer membrane protein assembly factor BamA [Sulfuriflexus sp.]
MKRLILILLLMAGPGQHVWANEAFVIKDIRVEGLQRIAAGTVFNYLPVKVGETLDDRASAETIRALFKTGFFKDVRLERENGVLIVFVIERPAIASIDYNGNKSIEEEALTEGLKEIGFAVGRVFDKSLLDKVEQELQRIYFSQGKYGVKMETTVTPLERNRVGITIDISEGTVAKIHQINIVGNTDYDDETLLDEFELSTPTLFSFYTDTDQYSKQKLAADLERLRSYYLNRGYINFNIDSTQVSITPDKRDVYITINITEGEKFTVKSVKLAGDLVVEPKELFPLFIIQKGDIFSRRRATETSEKITNRLGEEGYAFANVNVVPEILEEEKQVELTFFVDPGKRVYVRRINFSGNTQTRDEVLRREMRQFESAWISTANVERSKVRLDTLGYFDEVEVETPAVPGTTDQVDVNYKVKEKPSGNLLAGIGYSDSQGVIFNASVSQDNFLGSGKRISVGFDNSEINRVYRFGYVNPYWTEDGVSRGFNMLYRETDAAEANLASYTSDVFSGSMSFGIPITEFERVSLGIGYSRTTINTNFNTPQDFLDELGSLKEDNNSLAVGDSAGFDTFTLNMSFANDTRNRAIFPDRGGIQRISGEIALPGGDLEYYKFTYLNQRFFKLTRNLTLGLKGEVGYGDGYGSTNSLPFFENFLAGGARSVRGYEDNTLGPKIRDATSASFGDPLGGNLKTVASAELIFPVPFVKDTRSWRFSAFVDAGNVYGTNEDFEFDELRYAAGLGVTWLSPFGALSFSLAAPFNDQPGDDTKAFQFTFGGGF